MDDGARRATFDALQRAQAKNARLTAELEDKKRLLLEKDEKIAELVQTRSALFGCNERLAEVTDELAEMQEKVSTSAMHRVMARQVDRIKELEAELAAIKPSWDGGELREALADVSHEIWAHWMKYLFSTCEDDDLGTVIQWHNAERWKRQIGTTYADLSEREKDSDREQADKILTALRGTLKCFDVGVI